MYLSTLLVQLGISSGITKYLLVAFGSIGYRISLNRMRTLYLFHCFDMACIIQGCFVLESLYLTLSPPRGTIVPR